MLCLIMLRINGSWFIVLLSSLHQILIARSYARQLSRCRIVPFVNACIPEAPRWRTIPDEISSSHLKGFGSVKGGLLKQRAVRNLPNFSARALVSGLTPLHCHSNLPEAPRTDQSSANLYHRSIDFWLSLEPD